MIITLILIFGYLLGSINTSIIVGKIMGVDIRTKGSGNAGATNTLRSLGRLPALFVLLGDVLKGVIVVLVAKAFTEYSVLPIAAGFCAVVGHNYPLYFKFKGGKGIATSAAVIVTVVPIVGIVVISISLIIMLITKYVSLSSIIGTIAFIIISFFIHPTFTNIHEKIIYILIVFFISLLGIYRHKSNILRLINKTEPKLGGKKGEKK